jgi:hypothetical protein
LWKRRLRQIPVYGIRFLKSVRQQRQLKHLLARRRWVAVVELEEYVNLKVCMM